MTISKLIKAFSPSFKSLDLRIAAVKTADGWINVVTSLFPSNKPRKEIELEQKRIRSKLSKEINQEEFNIFLTVLPFKKLSDVSKQILNGGTAINHVSVKFRKFDPMMLRAELSLPNYLKDIEEWPLVGGKEESPTENGRDFWPVIDDQDGAAKRLGYHGIYDLINEVLGMRGFDRGRARDLVIGVPIYAKIVAINVKGSSIEITTKKHFALNNLQLNLFLSRVKGHTYERYNNLVHVVEECKREGGIAGDFCSVTSIIQYPNLQPHDMIDVTLINRDFPSLEVDTKHEKVPLEKPMEPFAKTLDRFCPIDLLKKQLLNPEQCEEEKIKPNKIFERAVAWLLSLAGFSVISLGPYEKLKERTKFETGSVDIIAYKENEYLLLVDCDTKISDEKKIGSLLNLKEHFRFVQDKQEEPRIQPVIFSPLDWKEIKGRYKEITIMDRSQIEWLFENVMLGKAKELRLDLATGYVYDV